MLTRCWDQRYGEACITSYYLRRGSSPFSRFLSLFLFLSSGPMVYRRIFPSVPCSLSTTRATTRCFLFTSSQFYSAPLILIMSFLSFAKSIISNTARTYFLRTRYFSFYRLAGFRRIMSLIIELPVVKIQKKREHAARTMHSIVIGANARYFLVPRYWKKTPCSRKETKTRAQVAMVPARE